VQTPQHVCRERKPVASTASLAAHRIQKTFYLPNQPTTIFDRFTRWILLQAAAGARLSATLARALTAPPTSAAFVPHLTLVQVSCRTLCSRWLVRDSRLIPFYNPGRTSLIRASGLTAWCGSIIWILQAPYGPIRCVLPAIILQSTVMVNQRMCISRCLLACRSYRRPWQKKSRENGARKHRLAAACCSC
jgi:hypothetical protein